MDRETKKYISQLGYYSTLGLQVAFSIFIGLGLGYWIDQKFSTSPWFLIIFLIFGIIAAYRNIGLAIKKIRKF